MGDRTKSYIGPLFRSAEGDSNMTLLDMSLDCVEDAVIIAVVGERRCRYFEQGAMAMAMSWL